MRTYWANALLSDGEILFWYTGERCSSPYDFYKDFYIAGIDLVKYEKEHDLKVVRLGMIDETEDNQYNCLCFDRIAKDFYRQYKISNDSRGARPY